MNRYDQQQLLGTIGTMLGLQWIRAQVANGAGQAPAAPPGPVAAATAAGEADAQVTGRAWQSLATLADAGSLSGLEDWQAAHPGLYAADARLQALVLALDFAGVARHVRGAQGL